MPSSSSRRQPPTIWTASSRWTPKRWNSIPARVSVPKPVAVPVDTATEQHVAELIRDEPVLLFALEWCEFCWSVRKLFARLDIAYRSIDLDSVAYQAEDLGGRVRAVLAHRTGSPTIPQVFIAGRHIGGCTDLFDGWRAGSIQRILTEKGIAYRTDIDIDPYSLLPKWQQPRKTA